MNNINSNFFSRFLNSNLNLLLKIAGVSFLVASQAFIASSASAGTVLSNKETFSGKVNYTGTGGTLRSNPDSSNACSLNSTSSAQLSGIPSNATVKKAYLYWAGSGSNVDSSVTLDGTSLTADKTYQDSFSTLNSNFFQGVKDVTNIVANKGNGTYQFKDLAVTNSGDQCSYKTVLSAWSLIVIYDDPSIPQNKLNTIKLYEGFKASRNDSVNYTLSGIKVASNPVAKFTMLLWEGDQSLGGSNEKLGFNNTTLTDSINPINNQFNSSINTLNLSNTYGLDLDTFNVSSYVTAGQTSVTGTVSTNDDLVLQGAALIMVTDTLANEAPSAKPDTIVTNEDTTGTYNLIAGNPTNNNGKDTDPEGDALTVAKFNVGGTEYTFDAQTTTRQVTMPSGALLTVKSNGDVTYNPNSKFESLNLGETGTDTFSYTIQDSKNNVSSATVTMTINGAADTPDAVDDLVNTDEDTSTTGNVKTNDTDPNGDTLTVTMVNGVAANVGKQITLPSGALLTLNSNGTFTYNPNNRFESLNNGQTATDTFTYTINDGHGNTDSASVSMKIAGVTDIYND